MRLCTHSINFQEERLILKKLFTTLAIAAVPFSVSQAESTMPNVLAGLDSSVQVMDEQQLNEVRGAGPLPNDFAYREHYYAWNNYGSQSDYRSYSKHGEAVYTGGKSYANGALAGDGYLVSTTPGAYGLNSNGPHSLVEIRAYYFDLVNATYQTVSQSAWNRPWNGTINYLR